MRSLAVAAGVVVGIVLAWAAVSGQDARERPGVGSGTVAVSSIPPIHVSTLPAVTISTLPAVAVSSLPSIAIAPHDFVKVRSTYIIVWPDGAREEVTALELGRAGWIRVAPRRWVNLDTARSVEGR